MSCFDHSSAPERTCHLCGHRYCDDDQHGHDCITTLRDRRTDAEEWLQECTEKLEEATRVGDAMTPAERLAQANARHKAVVTRATVACGPDLFCTLELRGDGATEYIPCGKHERKTGAAEARADCDYNDQ